MGRSEKFIQDKLYQSKAIADYCNLFAGFQLRQANIFFFILISESTAIYSIIFSIFRCLIKISSYSATAHARITETREVVAFSVSRLRAVEELELHANFVVRDICTRFRRSSSQKLRTIYPENTFCAVKCVNRWNRQGSKLCSTD